MARLRARALQKPFEEIVQLPGYRCCPARVCDFSCVPRLLRFILAAGSFCVITPSLIAPRAPPRSFPGRLLIPLAPRFLCFPLAPHIAPPVSRVLRYHFICPAARISPPRSRRLALCRTRFDPITTNALRFASSRLFPRPVPPECAYIFPPFRHPVPVNRSLFPLLLRASRLDII